jgi:GH25 family lysozyme M1 (1,4-beta-N-acetylmuramidase)
MIEGIDVSHHNAVTSYDLAGCSFLFARASYGMTADTTAEAHLARGRERGLVLGAYAYLYTGEGAAEPEAQADFFITRAACLAGPLMLALDVEPIDFRKPDPPARVADFALRFWRSAQARAGRPVAIYGGDYLGTIGLSVDIAAAPFWKADWQAPYGRVAPWQDWTILQYAVRGVDRDCYRGTVHDLRAAFGLPPGGEVSAPERVLKAGCRGADVVALQLLLQALGLHTVADGIYGTRTAGVVRAAQAELGLPEDGIAGPATMAALRGR